VIQSAVNGTEEEKLNELSAFQKNLQLYGITIFNINHDNKSNYLFKLIKRILLTLCLCQSRKRLQRCKRQFLATIRLGILQR